MLDLGCVPGAWLQVAAQAIGPPDAGGLGLVDTFRAQFPKTVGYTYYGHRAPNARAQNKGWRLDYFLVSAEMAPLCHDAYILKDVEGSDHVPLGLVLRK